MRIALCISGKVNQHLEKCSETIKTQLIDKYNVDVFGSFWAKNREEGARIEKAFQGMLEFEEYTQNHIDTFNKWDFEPLRWEKHRDPANTISMWYKIMRANWLREKFSAENNFSYDLVIRIRPDVEITKYPVLPLAPKENRIYLPDVEGMRYFGANDMCFAAKPKTYSMLCNNMYSAYRKIAKGFPTHPELFMSVFCFTNGLGYRTFEMDYNLNNV